MSLPLFNIVAMQKALQFKSKAQKQQFRKDMNVLMAMDSFAYEQREGTNKAKKWLPPDGCCWIVDHLFDVPNGKKMNPQKYKAEFLEILRSDYASFNDEQLPSAKYFKIDHEKIDRGNEIGAVVIYFNWKAYLDDTPFITNLKGDTTPPPSADELCKRIKDAANFTINHTLSWAGKLTNRWLGFS